LTNLTTKSKYLIDANVFIQAKNFHYRFDFCQGFWDWIIQANQANIVYSIDKVKIELERGDKNDPVRKWIDMLPHNFFLTDIKDQAVMASYRQIMQWNHSNNHYTVQAKQEFANHNVADAFLIAMAQTHEYKIVTYEKSNPDRKRRIPIPDAANVFGIECIMIYDLLSQYAEDNFSLKANTARRLE